MPHIQAGPAKAITGTLSNSTGSADAFAFGKALERAAEEVRNDVIQRISQRMTQMQRASPAAQAFGE